MVDMAKENFYILLELSLDPVENDPKIIESAIKHKQVEWSRLRNHPTKGVTVKNYLSMLPEIRKLMKDPFLQKAEADNAIQIIYEQEKEKYAEIDKHLAIRMSKGYLTEEEIFKLAKLHLINAKEIRKRIKIIEKDKFAKLSKQLAVRMTKGYITEDEISQLARLNSVKDEVVRQHVTCTIRKEAFSDADNIKPLDKSIQQIIEQNLKVAGHSSLYQFLDIPSSSVLDKIQKKITEKHELIKNTGKKDAKATAGDILIGHCTTIFSSDESRQSYDVIFAQSYLAEFNASIDVAGMDGIIRPEYFDALLKSAISLGMEGPEAEQYIERYCREKKWKIETKKKKAGKLKTGNLLRYAAGIILVALISIGILVFIDYNKKKHIKNEYQTMLVKCNDQQDIKQKPLILRNFLESHISSPYAAEVKIKLNGIMKLIDSDEFRKLMVEVDQLVKEKKYNQTISVCRNYLKKYPKTSFAAKVKQKIKILFELIDDLDYENLQKKAVLDIEPRLTAFTDYLKKHSDGKYVEHVRKMVSAMSGEYYIFVRNEMLAYKKNEAWEKGILLADKYIEIYKDSNRVAGIKEIRDKFRTFMWEKMTFDGLKKKAGEMDKQFTKAQQVYYDFLYAYPDTYLKYKVNEEIKKLDELKKDAVRTAKKNRIRVMIQEIGGKRYIDNNDGTVKDTKTGLIWCMFDSLIETGGCMNYDNAVSYVKEIKTGGFNDWRLPTRDELVKIYKSKPYFPQTEALWYWTAKNYSRYSDGWSKVVDIVTSKNQETSAKKQNDARDCGWVRAVRK